MRFQAQFPWAKVGLSAFKVYVISDSYVGVHDTRQIEVCLSLFFAPLFVFSTSSFSASPTPIHQTSSSAEGLKGK